MNMNIRTMTTDDYEKVYALWLNTPNMGLNHLDDSKEGISKFLHRNPHTCFVAESNHDIAGVILSGHDGRRGYIYHLAISTPWQSKGIGSTLVHAAMTALKNEGIHKVALVAFSKNESGNAFWEKQGFISRKDLVYRNKAISYLKIIETDILNQ